MSVRVTQHFGDVVLCRRTQHTGGERVCVREREREGSLEANLIGYIA
jgi:hypothetical protein